MKRFCVVLACLAVVVSASGLQATTIEGDGSVIVESRANGKNFADYFDTGAGFPDSWSASTAKSTAAGTTAGIGSRFNSNYNVGNPAIYFEVKPTLPANAGGTWDVYVTTPGAMGTTVSTSAITLIGATGLPATTDAFGPASKDVWALVGTLVKGDAGQITIRFDENNHDNRFYADAVKLVPTPEPTTVLFVALGAVGLVARRRRA